MLRTDVALRTGAGEGRRPEDAPSPRVPHAGWTGFPPPETSLKALALSGVRYAGCPSH